MKFKLVLAIAAAAATVSGGPVLAENEGQGEPFAFFAPAQKTTGGNPFTTDVGQQAYPQSTGNTNQASALAQLEPGLARERVIQSAKSMPASGWPRTGDFPQSADRQFASRAAPGRQPL